MINGKKWREKMSKKEIKKINDVIFSITKYLSVILLFDLFKKYVEIDTTYILFYIVFLCLIGFLIILIIGIKK